MRATNPWAEEACPWESSTRNLRATSSLTSISLGRACFWIGVGLVNVPGTGRAVGDGMVEKLKGQDLRIALMHSTGREKLL